MNRKTFLRYFVPALLMGFLVSWFFRTAQTQMEEDAKILKTPAEEASETSKDEFQPGDDLPSELPDSVPPAPMDGPIAQSVSKPVTIAKKELSLEQIPFDGLLAHQFITELCTIGPRPSDSEGMRKQQEYLIAHFSNCGALVLRQSFQFPYPGSSTQKVTGTNLIFRWKPERKERILLCAHYDTLPIPTANPPQLQNLPFVGAEDNAGGVAILMVLGKMIPEILEKEQMRYGVDVVMLDAEEFMFRPSRNCLPNERFCWGSEFFGRKYASQTPQERGFTYVAGVLLDMVTHFDVQLMKEQYSFQNRATRSIVNEIWNTARSLNVLEFDSRIGNPVMDDHLYLYEYGTIPVIDIIDLNYSPWHTHEDTPDKCSPLSAARVGWVLHEWIREKK